MQEQNKLRLLNQFDKDKMLLRYQQQIKYFAEGGNMGIIDEMEYKIFRDMTLKNDLVGLAHAYLNNLYGFDEYYDRLEAIVGFNLMVRGAMDNVNRKKSNGEDK